ncbi:adenosylcobinamide kinase/adenosylcobinamide-phosphate guanylyltransferase [Bacillus mesophilus]|uniref:Adenosylcobinamide kinase n=1 Tax=Bacillus mesophilus TaxID=1808955 RepID=A0A6M0Q4H3_9BACI|nr:bifunctional adenosylcobinamide kinase/adenosylcobinamide-phosphate guanylyltransferase [Bacillus mesophilus]MBM7661187.1 adenosylcobinamide kinase/adenosylcobinamide-phosphate guanylyltransferase [Bacillus mesophilus]NEY71286.1 bifunctional adenosylcobinamide kinase/adenosylcobinamide-phosphate guanylyltransferase [Bacillus mesophilus]
MLVFVSGGARSGKSTFAEQLVANVAAPGNLHYIATSEVTDAEMKSRIFHHQERRTGDWTTWEQPTNMIELAPKFSTDDCILLDCLTILTANELFHGGVIQSANKVYEKMIHSIKQFHTVKMFVIVSNDLFSDKLPDDEGSLLYMKLLGSLHQEIVRTADYAYQVNYGIPKKMKG